jgi:ribonuclease D
MIKSDGELAEFLPELQSAEWVALDTEADSLHAYPEKLCLIQISTARHDTLVDPLAAIDLAPLWPALKQHQLILHGADYDLRLLRKTSDFVPNQIFDTMLASRLLGEREFGLYNLVKKNLGITLEKGSQKADWSKRPLADLLKEQLRQKQRLPWLEQCCDRLIAECAIPAKPDPNLVWRVKGCHKLPPHGLAVLRQIWQWREKEARSSNRPPFFVLSHETLVAVSAAAIDHGAIDPLLPPRFSSRRKDDLQEAIQHGLSVGPEEHPQPLRSNSLRQTEAERRRFAALEQGRNRCANELQLDPTLIASRATLIALAHDWNQHNEELMDWQREILATCRGE